MVLILGHFLIDAKIIFDIIKYTIQLPITFIMISSDTKKTNKKKPFSTVI